MNIERMDGRVIVTPESGETVKCGNCLDEIGSGWYGGIRYTKHLFACDKERCNPTHGKDLIVSGGGMPWFMFTYDGLSASRFRISRGKK